MSKLITSLYLESAIKIPLPLSCSEVMNKSQLSSYLLLRSQHSHLFICLKSLGIPTRTFKRKIFYINISSPCIAERMEEGNDIRYGNFIGNYHVDWS